MAKVAPAFRFEGFAGISITYPQKTHAGYKVAVTAILRARQTRYGVFGIYMTAGLVREN